MELRFGVVPAASPRPTEARKSVKRLLLSAFWFTPAEVRHGEAAVGAPFEVDGQRMKSLGMKRRSLLPEPSRFGSPPMISEYGCPDCAVKNAPKLCVSGPVVRLYVVEKLKRCLT